MNLFALTDMERDVVIAALRLWQTFSENQIAPAIIDIATNGRKGVAPYLTDSAIDVLIEDKLNTDGLELTYIHDDDEEGGNHLFVVKSPVLTPMEQWQSYYQEVDLPEEYRIFDIKLNGNTGALAWHDTAPQNGGGSLMLAVAVP